MNKNFELIDHTADIQVRVYGETLADFFRHALQAMFYVIKPHISHSMLPVQRNITIVAPNKETMLVDFLSEALYFSMVHHEAYVDMVINKLTDTSIVCILHGKPIEKSDREIKAVTYHQLSIKQIRGIWQADIVFDI